MACSIYNCRDVVLYLLLKRTKQKQKNQINTEIRVTLNTSKKLFVFLVPSLFKKCIKERRIAYSCLKFFCFINIVTGTFFLFRILFASLFSPLQKLKRKPPLKWHPLTNFEAMSITCSKTNSW
jgi:hypothetical protein